MPGLLSQLQQWQAANVFGDIDRYAEPIEYTAFVAGVGQTPVPLNVVIDRSTPVVVIGEASPARVKQIRFTVANNATNGLSTLNLGDIVSAVWRIGDPPSTFRVVERPNQDAAMWYVVAEMSAN